MLSCNSNQLFIFCFSVNGSYSVSRTASVGQIDFTGQHRSKIINIDNNIQDYIGMIVVSTGKLDNLEKGVNEHKPNINGHYQL